MPVITAEKIDELRAKAKAALARGPSELAEYLAAADPTTVLALIDRLAELEARGHGRLPIDFEQSALVERIQHALDNATMVDGLTLADIVADAVLDFMPLPVQPDPDPPEVTAAVAEAQSLLAARACSAELALPSGWGEGQPGELDLAGAKHVPVSVRTGFDFGDGVPTTRFSSHFGDVYVPDVVLARRLAALGWSLQRPNHVEPIDKYATRRGKSRAPRPFGDGAF